MEEKLFSFIEKYMELSDAEKKAITSLAMFKSFKKGAILLQEGERTTNSYFVLQGCLRTYYNIDGEEKTTEFYTELEGVTPQCSVNKEPSECYIACIEDSIVLISNPDIEQLVFEKFPRFETLCRILSEELLAKSQTSFDDFKNNSPEQRYLNLLENRPHLVKRVPQHQLASYLGITRESLSRIRKRLATQKA